MRRARAIVGGAERKRLGAEGVSFHVNLATLEYKR
jgi:hypothetical protein